jgi:hypothetical protein
LRFEANDGNDRRGTWEFGWLVARVRGDDSIAPGNGAREDGYTNVAGIDIGQMFGAFPGPQHYRRKAGERVM